MSGRLLLAEIDAVTAVHLVAAIRGHRAVEAQKGRDIPATLNDLEHLFTEKFGKGKAKGKAPASAQKRSDALICSDVVDDAPMRDR